MAIQTSTNDTRTNVTELQTYLRRIAQTHPRIPLLNPDGNFGTETQTAVRAFQTEFDLPATGMVDYNTWNAIFDEYSAIVAQLDTSLPLDIFPPNTREITVRYSGDIVPVIQILLQSLAKRFTNMPPVTLTGIYDEQTERSVEAFQKFNNLPATGKVNKLTWNRLTQAYRSYLYNEI